MDYSLGDAGYLDDPEAEHGRVLQPNAVSLEQLESMRCLALLGEPGIGKSVALADERRRLVANGVHVLFIELLRASAQSLSEIVEAAAVSSTSPWFLLLDGLDEASARNPQLPAQLVETLEQCDRTQLRLRISCRSLEWPVSIQEKLHALWPGAGVYELLPLRRVDVRFAAEDYQIEPDEFLRAVQERDSTSLAIRPISLRFLFETYIQYGALAHSKLRLFDQGTLILCNEEGTWHRGGSRPHADAFRRRSIAARIAAVGTFTNRHGITRESSPTDHVTVTELAGGIESAEGATYEVTVPALEDTLAGTALFSAGPSSAFMWTHQSYREFLSAWYVAHRDLSLGEVESLYFQDEAAKRVPGPLREVAAWHATLVPSLFDLLVRRDPEVLLHSDSALSETSRMQLVEALLRRMDEFEADDRAYWEKDYRKLTHGALSTQLRPYIVAAGKNLVVRRAAMDIAWSCRIRELVPALGAVLEDPTEDVHARECAAYSLGRLDCDSSRRVLARVLAGDLTFDANDEVRGAALRALWPDHIEHARLFEHITPRKRENYSGGYSGFLDEMPAALPHNALTEALAWVEAMGDHLSFDSIARAQARILSVGFARLENPQVLAVVVRLVGKFVKSATGMAPGYHSNEELYTEALTDDQRRTILYAMVRADPNDEKLGRDAFFSEPSMLRPWDLAWLAETAMTESDSSLQRALGRLAETLYATSGYPTDAIIADTVARAADEIEAFRAPLADLFAPIDLISATADRLRDQWNMTRASLERRAADRESVDAAREAHFRERLQLAREALSEIEKGTVERWVTVYQILTHPRDAAIRGSLGWQELAEDQQRIVRAAIAFLNLASPPALDWMDENSIPWPLIAARAAFIVIGENGSDALVALSDVAWQHWGYVMVAVYFPTCPEPLRTELMFCVYQRGLENVSEAVRRIALRENRQDGNVMVFDRLLLPVPEQMQLAILSFVDELSDRGYSDAMYTLVASGSQAARAQIVSALASGPPIRAAYAARALLFIDAVHWEAVLRRMETDLEFARPMAELLAVPSRGATAPLSIADDRIMAGLALILLRQFPPEADPERVQGGLLTARDSIARFRDGLIEMLVRKGTPSAVLALESLVSAEPGRDVLRWQWMRARGILADVSWRPIGVVEFLTVVRVLATAIVVGDDQPRYMLVFDTERTDVSRISAFLSANTNGIVVRSGGPTGTTLVIDATPEAITRLVVLAESSSFNVANVGARLLGIRFGAEWLFEELPSALPLRRKFRDVGAKELKDVLERTAVVVATATDVETSAVLGAMEMLPGEDSLLEGSLDVTTYRVGMLGRYFVAHLQSAMGSTGVYASQVSICDAIHEIDPKVVIMVGIAFGLKRSRHRLGDVLVAEHVTGYEMVKLRPDMIDDRGPTIPASVVLTERFKSRIRDWSYTRADGSKVDVIGGRVVSGEKLVNNREFSAALASRFPDAVGGEMEGVGAYAVAARRRREILLVKSICDWADGLKNDRAQAFAAGTASSLVRHVLSKRDVLSSLGVSEYDTSRSNSTEAPATDAHP